MRSQSARVSPIKRILCRAGSRLPLANSKTLHDGTFARQNSVRAVALVSVFQTGTMPYNATIATTKEPNASVAAT